MKASGERVAGDRIAVAERFIAAYNAWDLEATLELLAEAAHADVVWRPAIGVLEGSEYRGAEGMRRYYEDFGASFQDARFEPRSFRAVGTDTVVVLGRLHGTGQHSGAAVSGERGVVMAFRDGKLASIVSYPSEAEAIRIAEDRSQ